MRIESQTSFGFEKNQYYDGIKNSLENELKMAKRELSDILEKNKNKPTLDSRLSMLVAEITGIGTKLNFYV